MDGIAFRAAEPEDWAGMATLLGHEAAAATQAGRRLREHVQQGYDPWFCWIAETAQPAQAVQAAQAFPRVQNEAETAADAARTVPAAIVGALAAGARRAQLRTIIEQNMVEDREGRVIWLGVTDGYRRRGIGAHLLGLALEELRHRQVHRVSLEVDGTQLEALALFRKAGFQPEGQSIRLLLPASAAARLAGEGVLSVASASVRAVSLDDVPLLAGLLIQLGIERAQAPRDDLPALTPAQLEDWLQRPGTVAYAAWEAADSQAPLALAWATRRSEDAVLRFIGVRDDARRQRVGRAVLSTLLAALARPFPPMRGRQQGAGTEGRFSPLHAQLNDPGSEQQFFRALGFTIEQMTIRMVQTL